MTNNKIIYFDMLGVLSFVVLMITVLFLFIVLPNTSYAATYAYINSSGEMSYVSANSFSEAFAKSVNISTHSGVMLVGFINTNTIINNQSLLSGYVYVNSSGEVTYVSANSSNGAFLNSINMSQHSGVMLISGVAGSNMIGDKVVGF